MLPDEGEGGVLGKEMRRDSYWENAHLLSRRLASLGIMRSQLRAPFKLLNTISDVMYGSFRGPTIRAP